MGLFARIQYAGFTSVDHARLLPPGVPLTPNAAHRVAWSQTILPPVKKQGRRYAGCVPAEPGSVYAMGVVSFLPIASLSFSVVLIPKT